VCSWVALHIQNCATDRLLQHVGDSSDDEPPLASWLNLSAAGALLWCPLAQRRRWVASSARAPRTHMVSASGPSVN